MASFDWKKTISVIAPTVASALGGPLAGGIVSALGDILGISEPTQDKIASAIKNGQLTGDQIAAIKIKEMELQNEELERGFKYEDLAFRDRDSARKANVEGGVQTNVFWLSMLLLTVCIGSECVVLFHGVPKETDLILVGRILGLLDSITLLVLSYWYGTTNSSAAKNSAIASMAAAPKQ